MPLTDKERSALGAVQAEREKMIASTARRIFGKDRNNFDNVIRRVSDFADDVDGHLLASDGGNEYEAGQTLSCAIWMSGSGSTGKLELEQAQRARSILGFSPVEYAAIVANSTNRDKCRAGAIAENFKLPIAELDFPKWYKEAIDPTSENPIKETGLFFKPGESLPGERVLSKRVDARAEFEETLLEVLEKHCPKIPQSHSLRGYSFPIINEIGQIDDTHPGDNSYRNARGALFPGWQSEAPQLMIDSGLAAFRGSLLYVDPIRNAKGVGKVDNGPLLALTQGDPGYRGKDGKDLQERMKITEDAQLTAMKTYGIIPLLMVIGNEPIKVPYQKLDEKTSYVEQQPIYAGNEMRSGREAFGQNISADLELLESAFA